MKSILRVTFAVIYLVAIATLLECGGGGAKQSVPLLTITTATLPNGTAGTEYSQSIQATGGVAPFHWSPGTGTLPNNLQLNPSSTNSTTISGTPDTPIQGDKFSVKVTDAANQTAIQGYQVSIMGLLDTLTLSPANLTFNPQLAGTASTTQTATLTNLGSTAIAINGVVATGNNSGDFTQTNTCVPAIAPNSSCEITVTFTPIQPGPRVASISVNDDTNDTPHQLGLNGTGISSGANATLSATGLTFSGQEVGTTSPTQTLTLTNYGEATLNIGSIAASGNFSESSTCGATLASGANCPINVSFSPATAGALTGSINVNDNVGGSPQTVALSGSGVSGGTLVLNGFCENSVNFVCDSADDVAECPVGVVATTPVGIDCLTNTATVDSSRTCSATSRFGKVTGWCAAAAAGASSRSGQRKFCNK